MGRLAEFGLARYLNELQQLPMLEPQEGYLLAKRWREHGDREAAHRLVTSHLRLVVKIAIGYRGYGLPISEMISEGNIGLIQRSTASSPRKASGSPPTPCGGSGLRSTNTFCAPGRR
jgi:RNA polymerase sigma-32 factor